MFLNSVTKFVILLSIISYASSASAGVSRCQLPEFNDKNFTGWSLSRTYEYDDPALGIDKRFESRMATANLYVYDLDLSNISAQDVRKQLDQAVRNALRHYHEQANDNIVIGDPNWMPDAVFDEFSDWLELGVYFPIETKQGKLLQMSIVGMGERENCFHKIRFSISFPEDLNEDELKYSFYQISMIEFYNLAQMIEDSFNANEGSE